VAKLARDAGRVGVEPLGNHPGSVVVRSLCPGFCRDRSGGDRVNALLQRCHSLLVRIRRAWEGFRGWQNLRARQAELESSIYAITLESGREGSLLAISPGPFSGDRLILLRQGYGGHVTSSADG
jgi:hypothetical protein